MHHMRTIKLFSMATPLPAIPLDVLLVSDLYRFFEEEKPMDALPQKIAHLHKKMEKFKELPWVGDLRQLGMISALELVKDKKTKESFSLEERVGWKIYLESLKQGLILRPMGDVTYLWLPLSTTIEEIDEITERTWKVLSNLNNILEKK